MGPQGNLAYKLPEFSYKDNRKKVQTREYRKRYKADPKRVTFNHVSEETRIAERFHHQMARQRIGAIFAVIIVVAFVAVTFAGILYRSSQILEMNYANVKLEREIKNIVKDNNQLMETMSKKTDLNLIRSLAIKRLSMQDPAQKQVVHVMIPVSDRIIIDKENQNINGDSTQLVNAFNNIEGFFKTIR